MLDTFFTSSQRNLMRLCYEVLLTDIVINKQKVLPFKSGGNDFLVGIGQVLEINFIGNEVFKRKGRYFYNFRGETLGLIFLKDYLDKTPSPRKKIKGVIVIKSGDKS